MRAGEPVRQAKGAVTPSPAPGPRSPRTAPAAVNAALPACALVADAEATASAATGTCRARRSATPVQRKRTRGWRPPWPRHVAAGALSRCRAERVRPGAGSFAAAAGQAASAPRHSEDGRGLPFRDTPPHRVSLTRPLKPQRGQELRGSATALGALGSVPRGVRSPQWAAAQLSP